MVWDDGSGEALYVAGQIRVGISCAPGSGVFKWDGSSWSAVGSLPMGASDLDVRTLVVFDAGNGPELYAGGRIRTATNQLVNVVRFDGTDWVPVGEGLTGQTSTRPSVVQMLEVFDDGNGPMLYAVGDFRRSGSNTGFYHIARTDGQQWSPAGFIGSVANPQRVYAIHATEDEDGPVLYAMGQAGWFTRWDGEGWVRFASGFSDVVSMATYDRGQGRELYAASFQQGVRRFNRIDGSWEPVEGAGLPGYRWLHVADLGDGEKLYLTGINVQVYDGQGTTVLGSLTTAFDLYTLNTYDDGQGPRLFLGGNFRDQGGRTFNSVAWWDGQSWSPTGDGPFGSIDAFEFFDTGSGPELYATGAFHRLGSDTQNRFLARRQGHAWAPVGAGINTPGLSMTAFDLGDGPALYIGASGTTTFLKWDGQSITPVTTDQPLGNVTALHGTHTADGPRLFVGGAFARVGTQLASRVAAWDGNAWSTLSGGVGGLVYAITDFDDGTGPAVYFAGAFTAVSDAGEARRIARWDGQSWSGVGTGLGVVAPGSAAARALAVFDDGTGPALYAGGNFTATPEQPEAYLSRWDGQSWSGVGGGVNGPVTALRVIDTGSGPALYVSGDFTEAGGIPVRNFAIYDDHGWRAAPGGPNAGARAMVFLEDDLGPAIALGGGFLNVADEPGGTPIPSATIATLRLCPSTTNPCPADLTGSGGDGVPDGVVDVADLNYYLGLWVAGDLAADVASPASSEPDGVVSVSDLHAYIALWLETQGACP
ncbi:MAG: hypothetical protein EA378_03750 [Phycisphaerales bacterium]|nr:MAG: hypothetical protein EA378_03750 [Phycisphaerales bacterium]